MKTKSPFCCTMVWETVRKPWIVSGFCSGNLITLLTCAHARTHTHTLSRTHTHIGRFCEDVLFSKWRGLRWESWASATSSDNLRLEMFKGWRLQPNKCKNMQTNTIKQDQARSNKIQQDQASTQSLHHVHQFDHWPSQIQEVVSRVCLTHQTSPGWRCGTPLLWGTFWVSIWQEKIKTLQFNTKMDVSSNIDSNMKSHGNLLTLVSQARERTVLCLL